MRKFKFIMKAALNVLLAVLLLTTASAETADGTEDALYVPPSDSTTATIVDLPESEIGTPVEVPPQWSRSEVCGDGIPPLPMTIKLGYGGAGKVTINGEEAEVGTLVVAVIGNTARGTHEYAVNPTSPLQNSLVIQGCASENNIAEVRFLVEYPAESGVFYWAEQSVIFESGAVIYDFDISDAAEASEAPASENSPPAS